MLLGTHVSTQGGIAQAVERAHKLGCNTMQFFSRNPQSWRNGYLRSEDIEVFIRLRKKFKIGPVFIHIPYLINLASPNPKLYWASIRAYTEDVQEAEKLKVDYIVTHMGSHKDTSEEAGLKRLAAALDKIISRTKDSPVGILLENTTGSGSWLGYKFVHQKKVISRLKDKTRVGLCLDTAHAYLAGYDISTSVGLERLLEEIEENVGLNLIKLIHLNDAPGELGCHRDTHTHIGKGNIGLEGMRRIINHPRFKDVPFILETPKTTLKDDPVNLKTVRKLRIKN
jgi:deoxyribonuclease-4